MKFNHETVSIERFAIQKTTSIEEISKIFTYPLYTISKIVYNMGQLINLARCWESIKGNGKER